MKRKQFFSRLLLVMLFAVVTACKNSHDTENSGTDVTEPSSAIEPNRINPSDPTGGGMETDTTGLESAPQTDESESVTGPNGTKPNQAMPVQ